MNKKYKIYENNLYNSVHKKYNCTIFYLHINILNIKL